MTKINWKSEYVHFIKTRFDSGYSMAQIARDMTAEFNLEVTRNMVRGKLNRLKVSRPRTDERENKIKEAAHKKPSVVKFQTLTAREPTPIIEYPVEDTSCEISELSDKRCKWPVGLGPPYKYCGAKTIDNRYCAHHASISRRKGEF